MSGTMDVQKALATHPEFGPVTMRYEDGGRFEVWQMGARSVRVPAGTTASEIRHAFDGDAE